MIKQAVILVGGLGTRLGPLTAEAPKPLLAVAGRPFLLYLIDDLRRHGIERILLLAGHRGEIVERFAANLPDVRVVVEPEPLGTGGAVRNAGSHLSDEFFFMNGDSFFDLNLWDLALFARRERSTAALALLSLPDVSRFGPAQLVGETIIGFEERAARPGPGLVNGGVAVLSREIVHQMPGQGAVSIERDIYPRLAAAGRLHGRAYDGAFIDIGVPEDFDRAQEMMPALARRPAVFVQGSLLSMYGPLGQGAWPQAAVEAVKALNDAGVAAYALVEGPEALAPVNARLIESGAHLDAIVSHETLPARVGLASFAIAFGDDPEVLKRAEALGAETRRCSRESAPQAILAAARSWTALRDHAGQGVAVSAGSSLRSSENASRT